MNEIMKIWEGSSLSVNYGDGFVTVSNGHGDQVGDSVWEASTCGLSAYSLGSCGKEDPEDLGRDDAIRLAKTLLLLTNA